MQLKNFNLKKLLSGNYLGAAGFGGVVFPTLAVASLVSAARPARASLALQRSSCLGVA